MKAIKLLLILIATSFSLIMISCDKDEADCYDEQLYQQHKNDNCTMEWSGVMGCDGKTYGNECQAAQQGIRIKN